MINNRQGGRRRGRGGQRPQNLSGRPEGNRQVRTVTLEVTPKQAERVAVATRLGRLALVVRSASGAEAPVEAATITWGGDVSPALRAGRGTAEAPPQTLQIFQGAAKREEFRF